MSVKDEGIFSQNLFCLKLQVETLVDDAGGKDALDMLNLLCEIKPAEQPIVLAMFKRVLKKIVEGKIRLETANDQGLHEFEEQLYNSIINELDNAKEACTTSLKVLDGGKSKKTKSKTIDFEQARKERVASSKLL